MATVASLVPRLTMQAPGLSEPAAELHLLDAAMEFCRRSYCWQEDLAPSDLTASVNEYSLGGLGEYRIVKVMKAVVGDTELEPITPDNLVDDWFNDTGTPEAFFLRGESVIVLYPTPTEIAALHVRVALAPSRTATTIPDVLADQWLEGLVAGALERACMTPGQPYSDPARAMAYRQDFTRILDKANLATAKGNARTPLRVRMHSF